MTSEPPTQKPPAHWRRLVLSGLTAVVALIAVAWAFDAQTRPARADHNEPASEPTTPPAMTEPHYRDHASTSAADAMGGAAPPVRIMVMGDSITQGFAFKMGNATRRPHTWRSFAVAELERRGVSVNMVGPNQGPYAPSGRGAVEVDPAWYARTGWSTAHASRFGRTLTCYVELTVNGCNDPQRADSDLRRYQPDVVVAMLGTNDFLLNPDTTTETMARSVVRLALLAHAVNPDMRILLVSPPATAASADRAEELRATMWITAAALRRAGLPVGFIHGGFGFNTATTTAGGHTIDGIHPNALGDRLIATNVLRGLNREPVMVAGR